ncbi:IS3 family transposase [Bacillus sp. T17B1]|nr:IS3 family transposase [Bacillus sp. T17B1]
MYQWVKKYEEGGEEALKDKRGKRKTDEELTPQEEAQRKNKRLERENERLRAEVAFLKKWVTDVTELKYGHRKAYLSAIMDLHEGMIVSYVLGESNNNALVFETFKKVVEAAPNTQPLLHSDRGFQYTSYQFRRMVDKANMTQSMSRVGRCIDNGPIESFWGKLKCEKYRRNSYETYEELQHDIDEYTSAFTTTIVYKKN